MDTRDFIAAMMHGSNAPNAYIDEPKPVDGTFTTRAVEWIQAGYTAVGEGVQGKQPDHRCIWMDTQTSSGLWALHAPSSEGHTLPS
jgi:hypothetical protein